MRRAIILAVDPQNESCHRALTAAQQAAARGEQLYIYCLDDGVAALDLFAPLADAGAHLFGCAYAARRRNLGGNDKAMFAGLGTLADLIAGCDVVETFTAGGAATVPPAGSAA